MNIQSEKQILIEWVSNLDNEEIIEQLKLLKENSINVSDWWNQISDAEKKGIEKGLKDLEDGKEVSIDKVREKYGKWLAK